MDTNRNSSTSASALDTAARYDKKGETNIAMHNIEGAEGDAKMGTIPSLFSLHCSHRTANVGQDECHRNRQKRKAVVLFTEEIEGMILKEKQNPVVYDHIDNLEALKY
ncbi:unnamed protein product [Acanthoscelides obtectus]|uniref:Uncharacterized protein n=1 Tax=Acanthoscelides obtectus TaxID=200917 RepID=A0A9P0KK62_ACAOB|nr:unnamed protein product [Acanthoscelides obtectus]CAK1667674.1 hypothetical protein AOBTE_LOCUS25980 [Acanthoscelides obtectus]